MGERWIPEAERLTPAGTYGTMSGKGGPRATLHCTVSAPTQFGDMHRVLTSKKAEPHLLYSFADDRLGQYFPLDASARALMGSAAVPSGVSHNRVGTINIQIEVVGSTDDWTARPDWRPGPRFRAMMRAIASWGVKPEFIYRPATTSTDRAHVVRSFATMTGDAGGWRWWGHCHYPDGESHWDPGRVNLTRFFAAATTTSVQEDDMPLTTADKPIIEQAVHAALLNLQILVPGSTVTAPLQKAIWAHWSASLAGKDAALAAAKAAGADLDEAALAASLAPLLLPALRDALLESLPDGALTRADVEAASEAAIRKVLGSVDAAGVG
jgi:hypothetical protein